MFISANYFCHYETAARIIGFDFRKNVPVNKAMIQVMFIFHNISANDNELGNFIFLFQPRQP
jgi:hypothetical protein